LDLFVAYFLAFGSNMTNTVELFLIVFLWRIKVIDSLTAIQFFVNLGTQYASIALSEFATAKKVSPASLVLAPIRGLEKGFKKIRKKQKNYALGCFCFNLRCVNDVL
jgi:hypothetical protein